MEDQNNNLLLAILVIATLSLITSLAVVKEETKDGKVATKFMGKTLWKAGSTETNNS